MTVNAALKMYEDTSRVNGREALAGARQSDRGRGVISSPPLPLSLTIPTPPSVNQAYKNVPKRGRCKTKAAKDWEAAAMVSLRRQCLPSLDGRFLMIVGVERMSDTADVSNRLKLAEDVLVKAGIIPDDRFITGHCIAWMPHANSLTHIQIIPILGGAVVPLEFHASSEADAGAWIMSASQDGGSNEHFPSIHQDGDG